MSADYFADIARALLETCAGPFYVAGNETQKKQAAQEAGTKLALACTERGFVLVPASSVTSGLVKEGKRVSGGGTIPLTAKSGILMKAKNS